MAYTVTNYKTKTAIKRDLAAGRHITCYQPGLGADLSNFTGKVTLEGPHFPKPHKWYGRGRLENGKLVSIK